jgi:hypothetical protein
MVYYGKLAHLKMLPVFPVNPNTFLYSGPVYSKTICLVAAFESKLLVGIAVNVAGKAPVKLSVMEKPLMVCKRQLAASFPNTSKW